MDFLGRIILQVNETVAEAVKVDDAPADAGKIKFKSTPEGMLTAYVSLVVMALVPIVIGAYKSVQHHRTQKEESKKSGEAVETMTSKDAMMFPVIASCALFGLYILFRIFSKEYINYLMTGYFVILGALAMSHLLAPVLRKLKPPSINISALHLTLSKEDPSDQSSSRSPSRSSSPSDVSETGDNSSRSSLAYLIDFRFDYVDVVSFIVSAGLAVWYLLVKHWVANNLFGIAFAINGVELLHLNSVTTGCILLGGLFFYDVFWVFGTDVMVTVAKSFEAPIKLVFPQDFLEKGFFGTNMAMLGLGDIVIPGIFIALLLRFDRSLNRSSNSYFNASFIAYILGLITTIVVMSVFKHAQPALLYLVPFCISFPVLLAVVKGDLKTMFDYEDHPSVTEDKKDQ